MFSLGGGWKQTIERRNELIRRNEEERKRFEEDYHRMGNFIDKQNSLFGTCAWLSISRSRYWIAGENRMDPV